MSTPFILAYHGAYPGTTTDVTGLDVRHKRADNDTADLSAGLPIPAGGSINYGWAKHEKILWSPGPASTISDLQWYADPSPDDWTGMTLWVGITAGYTVAGAHQQTGRVYGSMANANNYPPATPLSVQAGSVLAAPNAGTGTQSFLIQQLAVTPEALPGAKTARNVFYRWSEV